MTATVIYHAQCDDGTTAAAIAKMALPESTKFFAANYNEPPPDITGQDVFILDFSYAPDVVFAMAAKANSLTLLDHHLSAMKAFEPFLTSITDSISTYGRGNTFIAFDMNRSGAGMAWDSFFPMQRRPDFVDYIEANDLWKHDRCPNVREIIRWIRSHPHSIESYTDLMQSFDLEKAGPEALGIERYFQRSIINHVQSTDLRSVELAGVTGIAINGPWSMTSELGHHVAGLSATFGAVWYPKNSRAYVSLRGLDGGVDVSVIAKAYGGGGHRAAAGFTMELNEWLQKLGYSPTTKSESAAIS